MKIIFVGTTVFGIPTLEKLKADHQLVLVITQPDMPTGRKRVLTPPPIKVWSHKNNIPLSQPVKILDCQEEITKNNPDLILVAAYGQIIPKAILDIPKFGSINIHGSLLPKYRGASPIQSAIQNGDKETGITLIKMDEKMDHGPIISKERVAIDNYDDFEKLYKKLSNVASDLTAKTLPDYISGKVRPAEQVHTIATFCKMINRADARIDWTTPVKS